jgi:hypothetical protein
MSQLSFESLFLADQADPQPRASDPARMLSPAEARKQFASVFRQTAKNMRRSEVFRDFITLAASELDMARIRSPENIENSRRICGRYQPDDLDAMSSCSACWWRGWRVKCMIFSALCIWSRSWARTKWGSISLRPPSPA